MVCGQYGRGTLPRGNGTRCRTHLYSRNRFNSLANPSPPSLDVHSVHEFRFHDAGVATC